MANNFIKTIDGKPLRATALWDETNSANVENIDVLAKLSVQNNRLCYNNGEVGAGIDINIVTKAQYDALTLQQKEGKIYDIIDD